MQAGCPYVTISSRLAARLADPALLTDRARIGSQWVEAEDGGRCFEVTNPATGEVLACLPDLTIRDFRLAIDAAEVAQKSWAMQTGKHRSAVLKNWYRLWVGAVEDLASILTAEQGKPLAEAREEVLYGAAILSGLRRRQSAFMEILFRGTSTLLASSSLGSQSV